MAEKERIVTNEEGTLLGLIGPAWAVMVAVSVLAFILISVFFIGDPNFR
jgi:hypothetical protein